MLSIHSSETLIKRVVCVYVGVCIYVLGVFGFFVCLFVCASHVFAVMELFIIIIIYLLLYLFIYYYYYLFIIYLLCLL